MGRLGVRQRKGRQRSGASPVGAAADVIGGGKGVWKPETTTPGGSSVAEKSVGKMIGKRVYPSVGILRHNHKIKRGTTGDDLLILFACRQYDSRGRALDGQRHALWEFLAFMMAVTAIFLAFCRKVV
jgi:hypothetical protein